MVQKRQLAEEECDVSPKHFKLEHSWQLVPFLQFSSKDMPSESGEAEDYISEPITVIDCAFEGGKFTDIPICAKKVVEYTLSGSLSTSSLVGSMTRQEDLRSAAPTLTTDYNPLKPRTLIQPEDTYSYLLRRPPLKRVPIGPEYQADIPEWCGYDEKNGSHCSRSSEASTLPQTFDAKSIYVEDEIKFLGSCVIPAPDTETILDSDDNIGRGRADCCCNVPGSVRCIQQHIRESRESLQGSIGHERFAELGFGNMGEVVAEKWTEEDEELFLEVVYSNPASFGKNFWNHLSAEFPSRTRQEIVSYYFNVFVLRSRAKQNRCDPINVDSDDDEWQASEGSEDDEVLEYDSHSPVNDYYSDVGIFPDHNRGTNLSGTQSRKLLEGCSFDSTFQPWEKPPVDKSGEDQDFKDDFCTSPDTVYAPQMSKSRVNHELIFEPSDSKVWEVGHFSFPRTKTDFLPTGSMIEEVFGAGSWNSNVSDDDKGSA